MNNKQQWLDCDMSQEVRDGLTPLFDAADENNLWFYCSYQSLWFSPDVLRQNQIDGRFRWGAVNWKLRSPQEKVAILEDHVKFAEKELVDFRSKI